MSDVLGARIGFEDSEQIAKVRESAPQTVVIGTKTPTATPSRRRGLVPSMTTAAISKAVTRELCRRMSW
jgi:hypothetical protein